MHPPALYIHFYLVIPPSCGPDSVVGIATGYGLDGLGIESRWGDIFFTSPDRPWGPPNLLYSGYSDRDVTLTPHPLLVPLVMKG